jgi:hypothetical protein
VQGLTLPGMLENEIGALDAKMSEQPDQTLRLPSAVVRLWRNPDYRDGDANNVEAYMEVEATNSPTPPDEILIYWRDCKRMAGRAKWTMEISPSPPALPNPTKFGAKAEELKPLEEQLFLKIYDKFPKKKSSSRMFPGKK